MVLSLKYKLFDFFYKILKKFLFLFNPESVHDRALNVGIFISEHKNIKDVFGKIIVYKDRHLNQNICGIEFDNPIGLSAGFDKNGVLCDAVSVCGFGFVEIGSVTGEKCEGNPKPRLWRMVKDNSICVWYGLPNEGSEKISAKLRERVFDIPVGISIAKTNSPKTVSMEGGVNDYLKSYRQFYGIGDYVTINISCPNTYGGEPFLSKEYFSNLIQKISEEKKDKPVFVKLSPDLSDKEVDDILDVCLYYGIDGVVISNLIKNRDNIKIKSGFVPDKGGFSGKLVENKANQMIEYVYKKTKGNIVIIGCGGVFNGYDAYKKIKLGASLIQMITGMIFQGPHTPAKINYELANLLKKDGFSNISDAVGSEVKS